MTTYTMNGHKLPTRQVQPEILEGAAWNQVAKITRAQWRLQSQPEKYSCLESPDPRDQLQAALKQIETLLQENTQLVKTVLLLDHALSDALSLIHADETIDRSEGRTLRLSDDLQRCMEQLREKLQANALK